MPVGKSSIKRMSVSQETEEKKDTKISVEQGNEEIKSGDTEKKTRAAVQKGSRTVAQGNGKKVTQQKRKDNESDEMIAHEMKQEEESAGVVSKITCELPIYLM